MQDVSNGCDGLGEEAMVVDNGRALLDDGIDGALDELLDATSLGSVGAESLPEGAAMERVLIVGDVTDALKVTSLMTSSI
jgi:hypothetical protein